MRALALTRPEALCAGRLGREAARCGRAQLRSFAAAIRCDAHTRGASELCASATAMKRRLNGSSAGDVQQMSACHCGGGPSAVLRCTHCSALDVRCTTATLQCCSEAHPELRKLCVCFVLRQAGDDRLPAVVAGSGSASAYAHRRRTLLRCYSAILLFCYSAILRCLLCALAFLRHE